MLLLNLRVSRERRSPLMTPRKGHLRRRIAIRITVSVVHAAGLSPTLSAQHTESSQPPLRAVTPGDYIRHLGRALRGVAWTQADRDDHRECEGIPYPSVPLVVVAQRAYQRRAVLVPTRMMC